VQLPFSAALPEALTTPSQEVAGELLPALEAAQRLGLAVVTSGPLSQGRLAKRALPPAAAALLEQHAHEAAGTAAQRALRIARSGGAHVTLVGMGRPEHVTEDLAAARAPRLPAAELRRALGAAG